MLSSSSFGYSASTMTPIRVDRSREKPLSRQPKKIVGLMKYFALQNAGSAAKQAESKKATVKRDLLHSRTHFTESEVKYLSQLYRQVIHRQLQDHDEHLSIAGLNPKLILAVNGVKEKMSKVQFHVFLMDTFAMHDAMMAERIFNVFDKSSNGTLSLREWIYGLSIMLRGTPHELRHFCFSCYDILADGFVAVDEVRQFLKGCFRDKSINKELVDDSVWDLVEMIVGKMDVDGDNKISFEDYIQAVNSDPLLMEAFGQCLPEEKYAVAFELKFAEWHVYKKYKLCKQFNISLPIDCVELFGE